MLFTFFHGQIALSKIFKRSLPRVRLVTVRNQQKNKQRIQRSTIPRRGIRGETGDACAFTFPLRLKSQGQAILKLTAGVLVALVDGMVDGIPLDVHIGGLDALLGAHPEEQRVDVVNGGGARRALLGLRR